MPTCKRKISKRLCKRKVKHSKKYCWQHERAILKCRGNRKAFCNERKGCKWEPTKGCKLKYPCNNKKSLIKCNTVKDCFWEKKPRQRGKCKKVKNIRHMLQKKPLDIEKLALKYVDKNERDSPTVPLILREMDNIDLLGLTENEIALLAGHGYLQHEIDYIMPWDA